MTLCWIVTEGMAGTENQCLGVAEALGVMPVIKRIGLRQPWKTLSPWIGFEQVTTFTGDSLAPPWPDLLIAAGRKAIAAARYIKRLSNGKTMTVFLQDPRSNVDDFNLVAVPAHDPTRGQNVIVTQAAPNRITPQRLADGRRDFEALLSPLPQPRVAVLIGGNSKAFDLTPALMQKLATSLRHIAALGAGLMITTSRRTGNENLQILTSSLNCTPESSASIPVLKQDMIKERRMFVWDGTGGNPYFGLLGWADFILVTADSVSMISEAATTGKPVYIVPLEGGGGRIGTFHKNLLDSGIIRMFDGKIEPYTYTPLNDSALIATEIRRRLETGREPSSQIA